MINLTDALKKAKSYEENLPKYSGYKWTLYPFEDLIIGWFFRYHIKKIDKKSPDRGSMGPPGILIRKNDGKLMEIIAGDYSSLIQQCEITFEIIRKYKSNENDIDDYIYRTLGGQWSYGFNTFEVFNENFKKLNLASISKESLIQSIWDCFPNFLEK